MNNFTSSCVGEASKASYLAQIRCFNLEKMAREDAEPSRRMTVYLLGAVAVAIVSYYFIQKMSLSIKRRKMAAENGCKPSHARLISKEPFLGLDLMFENLKAAKEHRLLETQKGRFDKMGATFTGQLLGKPLVVSIEPQNIKTVLSLKFKDYILGGREAALGPLLGKGIFTTDGERWAHSRAMIRPNFARDQVADLGAFERHIQQLFKLIPRDGSTVDLQELFFRLTIDSATEFLFGHSVNSLSSCQTESDTGVQFAKSFNYAQHECAQRFRMGPLMRFYKNATGDRHVQITHEFVDQFVDRAIEYRRTADLEKAPEKQKGQYLFLHELAKATDDKRRLRDELLNVLLAGRDTTASLLSNMFFEIAKRPNIWAKLRAEVAELDGELPTYDQLRNLKYLKYCLNECELSSPCNVQQNVWTGMPPPIPWAFEIECVLTSFAEALRLHPVVPGNSRFATVDTVLPLGGGPDGKSPLFVKKGTVFVYSPYTMHRRKDYYGEDAEEFKPERWETLRPGWVSLQLLVDFSFLFLLLFVL